MKADGNSVFKVKEEVTSNDEFALSDLSTIEVKQEYHCKEEINMEWDEKDNYNAELESTFNNISHRAAVKSESDNASSPILNPLTLKTRITQPKKTNALPKPIKRCCPKCDNLSEVTKNFPYREMNCATCSTLLMYQCAKCDKRYTNYDSIIYHFSSKCDPAEYRKCDFCDYGTTISTQLAKHVKRVHENNCKRPKLKCEKCGKEFKYGYSLNRHAKKSCGLHYPKCFVECASCDKKFKDVGYLVEHEKVCEREVRLRCDHCDFESKYRQRLITHLRKRHSRGGRKKERKEYFRLNSFV